MLHTHVYFKHYNTCKLHTHTSKLHVQVYIYIYIYMYIHVYKHHMHCIYMYIYTCSFHACYLGDGEDYVSGSGPSADTTS